MLSMAGASNRIDPIYWRIDNHRFKDVRYVNFEDKMDIFCPEVSTNSNPETVSSSHHYQTIHLVDREAYDTCTLNGSEQYVMRCDTPHKEKKFTLMFRRVNPSPFGFEFSEGSYYLISTSSGTKEGQDQFNGGVCRSHSMKVKFDVKQGEEETVEQINLQNSHRPNQPSQTYHQDSSDYTVYPAESTDTHIESELITDSTAEKILDNGNMSTAIIVGIVFSLFIMVLMVIAFILFKRTSAKSKGSSFNPSTMSDYTIGKGRFEGYHDSYQDHVTHHTYDYAIGQQHAVPTHPVPYIKSPTEYGKIVTLYPKTNGPQTMGQSQPTHDFTYRPVSYGPDLTAHATDAERLSERTNQTVLV